MSAGAIILLIAVCAVFVFELSSLIVTIVKKKNKAKSTDTSVENAVFEDSNSAESVDDNSNKEVNA